MGSSFLWLALFAGYVVAILIGGFGVILLWKMAVGTINLNKLISEEDGDASLSRFQFLIFTFVIGMSLLLLVLANIDQGVIAFPAISAEALALLGISGGTYAVSKGIQKSSEVAKQAGKGQAAGGGNGAANQPGAGAQNQGQGAADPPGG